MGGKSKTEQSTTNRQLTNNIVNDGQFAGAGTVSIDESDRSVTIDEDYDYSTEIDDSFNTDNSIKVGDGNIAGGNITLSDSGAIDAAKEIASEAFGFGSDAISANERISRDSIKSAESTAAKAFSTSVHAIDEVSDFAEISVEAIGSTSTNVINELTSSSKVFADNLSKATQANFNSNEKALLSISDNNSKDKETIAELARNTSLSGQDIVARSSEKMTMYMAIAATFGFIAIAYIASSK